MVGTKKWHIGLVAEKGAGKTRFVELVKELYPSFTIASVRFSDPLRDIVKFLGKEETRENLQTLATALRETFKDDGVLNDAVRSRVGALQADVIFLDGLRKPEEVMVVRELGGILIYIHADQQLRFERRKQVSENSDEHDMGWEQFLRQDLAPPEVSIRMIGDTMADFKIDNSGTIDELKKQIKALFEKIGIAP